MAVSLRSMYYDTKEKYKMELIAGDKGLDNVVSWVHFMEDITTMDFIKGSELIITTGMGNNSEERLYELIQGLVEKEESGLIVNTGVYINNIPKCIIDYCNEASFPLFVMLWEIHLVDIMQDYCNRIFIERQNELNENAAFINAIFSPKNSEVYGSYLAHNGYDLEGAYSIFIINFSNYELSESIKIDILKKLKILIANIANRLFIKHSIVDYDEELIVVIHNISQDGIEKYAQRLNNAFKNSYDEYKIKISVGSRIVKIDNLFKSYKHALFAQKTIANSEKRLCFYNEIGINKIIFDVSDKDTLIDFYKYILGDLEEYDKKHNTEYMKTLRLYIDNNCSIKAVAEITFNHRNTINYRIKKIKNILKSEIQTMDDKFNYKMAFYIRDILEIY